VLVIGNGAVEDEDEKDDEDDWAAVALLPRLSLAYFPYFAVSTGSFSRDFDGVAV